MASVDTGVVGNKATTPHFHSDALMFLRIHEKKNTFLSLWK